MKRLRTKVDVIDGIVVLQIVALTLVETRDIVRNAQITTIARLENTSGNDFLA